MSEWTELLAGNALWVGLLMGLVWGVSVLKRDASVVDPYWSVGFLAVAINTAWTRGTALQPASLLLLALVAVWALRLWAYLTYRGWGEEEDFRYRAFREQFGPERYWWVSLFQVFGLQGLLILCISAPLQIALATAPPIGPFQVAGATLFGLGFLCEAIGDAQLLRFKANPANAGRVLDRGLWRYTRHPNYFGEALLWWGFGLFALDHPAGPYALLGPALMTVLLLKVSGVSLLEPALTKRRPDYAEYVRRTSAFVPWPPRAD